MNPFPEAVDSSWINDFKNCAQKFEYSALEGALEVLFDEVGDLGEGRAVVVHCD